MKLNVDLLHADKHFSYKLISTLLSIKISHKILSLLMETVKHPQRTQSSKLAISLLCVEKEVRLEFIFCKQMKHQFLYKLVGLLSLIGVARYVQSTENRKLVNFLQYLKKCHDCFCVLLWCKAFRCFTRDQSCLLLLVLVTVSAQVVAIHKFNTKEQRNERKTTYVEVH